MTREQALAVAWTGLNVLAMNGELVIYNDKKGNRAWFGIVNTRVDKLTMDGGKFKLKLTDLTELPTLLESVGSKEEANG